MSSVWALGALALAFAACRSSFGAGPVVERPGRAAAPAWGAAPPAAEALGAWPPPLEGGPLRVGDRVIDERDKAGTVRAILGGGEVLVRLDGGLWRARREAGRLAKSVGCLRGICIGHSVIDSENKTGTLMELFANGKARVKLDGRPWTRTRELGLIAKSVGCMDGICLGDLAVDAWGELWEVEDVFADGRARVRVFGIPWTGVRDVSSLSTDADSILQATRRRREGRL